MMPLFDLLSLTLAVSYMVLWSICFECIWYEVYRLKDGDGVSLNFSIINLIGFVYYFTYNTYALNNVTPYSDQVHISDAIFAGHAILLVLVHLYLPYYYPRKQNQFKPIWIGIAILLISNILVYWFIFDEPFHQVVLLMGYNKVVISFIKYIPQILLNYKRKSTKGWSVYNVIFDFIGAALSTLEVFLEGAHSHNHSQSFNYVKMLLGIEVMFFNAIFYVQHFILYAGNNAKADISANQLTMNDSQKIDEQERYSNKTQAQRINDARKKFSLNKNQKRIQREIESEGGLNGLKGLKGPDIQKNKEFAEDFQLTELKKVQPVAIQSKEVNILPEDLDNSFQED